MVERGLRYSMKGVVSCSGSTRWFGRNLRASALGVVSVWMKMVRRAVCGRRDRQGWACLDDWRRGRRGDVVGVLLLV